MSDYILHRASGWTKPGHKYIDRFKKNGKWFYVYKNGKKYNKIQDWLGVDERDQVTNPNAETVSYLYGNRITKPNYYTQSYKTLKNVADDLNKHHNYQMANQVYEDYGKKLTEHNKALKKYYNTPLGKIEKIANKGADFLSSISSVPSKIKKK